MPALKREEFELWQEMTKDIPKAQKLNYEDYIGHWSGLRILE
ncbi:hypothetical protein [Enterococcus plantarum]|nr:hypothetical protein [Enterococcus plantarum]